MSGNDNEGINPFRLFARDIRHMPTLVALVVFVTLLPFIQILPNEIARYLIPSIAIYSIGSFIISYLHCTLGNRKRMENIANKTPHKGVDPEVYWRIVIAQIVWFAFLIIYNCYRGVL